VSVRREKEMRAFYISRLLCSFVVFSLLFFIASAPSSAQSGNGFEITEAVVASGDASSAGGIFEVDSTLGQPVLGGASGSGSFALTSGFWNYIALAPTAAPVSISGRVLTPTGAGLFNAVLYLQNQDGEILVTRSGSFGYYMFDGIEAGQTVFISVESKRYMYAPRTIRLADVVNDLDFTPEQ
jgi:hypothetical protein